MPVLVGSALAARGGGFRPLPALAALLGALCLQIGTNLANDVDDFERGTDGAARRGPLRVTQSGLLPASRVRTAAWMAFGVGALIGLYLVAASGWPIAVLGAASIAAGWAYTGGPWPLGYHGLGDACVFLFFGVAAVAGTVYVQTGTTTPLALTCALPIGALATAILVVNNVRDADGDRRAGKYTVAVRFGTRAARLEYLALLALAGLVPPLLFASGTTGAAVLLPCATLPQALWLARRLWAADDGPTFNALLRDTARLHAWFGGLFALGLLAA